MKNPNKNIKSFEVFYEKSPLILIFRVLSLVFIESNNNLRQRRKWTGNYIGEEKNFAEKFRFRCFFCPLYFLSLALFFVARVEDAHGGSSVTPYFTRLRAITGRVVRRKKFPWRPRWRGRTGILRVENTRRRELINPRTFALDNTNSSELSYFFLIHSVRASQQLNKSRRSFKTKRSYHLMATNIRKEKKHGG